MIVWGGCTGSTSCPNEVYTGGRYNPLTDAWMETSIQSAPSQRSNASAVWTGTEMIVWGGLAGNVGTYTTSGGFYHVSTIPNEAPVASPDSFSTDEDLQLTVPASGVLENDTDEDGNPLSALLVSNPIHGDLNLEADGSFTYMPDSDFSGSDHFNYRATDGLALSNIVAVTITVSALNDPPVALDDSFSLTEDTPLVIDPPGILSNDSDVDSEAITATLVVSPSHGSLTLDADGGFTYTPSSNYFGTDSFSYRGSDGLSLSEIATVTLTIEPVNDAPVVGEDTFVTIQGSTLEIDAPGVLANDTDVDGDELSAELITQPQHGNLTLNPDGSFTYTPTPAFSGEDSFTYRASDGAAQSEATLVQITVEPLPPPASEQKVYIPIIIKN
jgi:VCBS repeat-containing protein